MDSRPNTGGRRRLAAVAASLVAILLLTLAVQTLRTSAPEPDPDPPEIAEVTPPPPLPPPRPPDEDALPARSGLHYTPEELEIWRERAESGPYRSPGDAGENSPGDWERISDNAEEFLDDPSDSRWEGPSGDGCVKPSSDKNPPTLETSRLRDAAFYYLITHEEEYRDAVKDELLEQSEEEGVDFEDSDRWCPRVLNDLSPALAMAHWLTKLLFAYDYLGEDSFSDDEREQLDDWFYSAADFFRSDLEASLDDNFVDRQAGNYEMSSARAEDPDCDGRTAYYGSKPICAIARYYNNRRAAQMRFVGLVGIHQDDSELKESAARFVREFIAYSVYPEGYFGDFERWAGRLPDLGWAYSANAVGAVVTIADHFARSGDPSLYEFSTSAGAQGTEGGPKSLLSAIHMLGAYVDGTFERYATDDESDVGESDHRIDGSHEESDWHSLHDLAVMHANVFYRDDYVRELYTRSGEEMSPYPEDPATNGDHEIWKGESGIYPGVLFMFGGTEGLVWPYPSSSAPQTY